MSSNSSAKGRFHFSEYMEHTFMGYFTQYKTPKFVLIHTVQFSVLLRIIQIIIITYSTLYLLVYQKGYQKHVTTVISSVTLKVKGVGQVEMPQNKTIIMDVADYVIPPLENNAIFVMTNFVQTNQRRSTCAESWCPPEDAESSSMFIQGSLNFTIFIKTFIEFPLFGVKNKNMVDNLKQCVFDPIHNKDCPVFTIDYMLNQAENDSTERDLMLRYGGVINIKIHWDCDLDRSIKLCKPEYTFTRLDVPFHEKPFSAGYNFRYTSTWKQNEEHFRILTKAYGLRFIITISGNAGKFSFITLTLNIGSLIGIFGIATFVSDIIVFHVSKRAGVYRSYVFEKVQLKTSLDGMKDHSKLRVEKNEDQLLNDTSNMDK
ncbi:unnamed protein product [Rotaria sp. Silwood2]|nr:unnamed protein product [Rotaria sp. Silwood2]CAF2930641.1 unnamed protein product [Rotaria sp. Silwood2]CAF3253717.1 unnamed protein product [Rotaria sp. Silwood2]CAF4258418.1 unnamed protein product [Rotaria sp. Silwood2]CAF4356683.1 unnamed protein product [Rotaria sp. Silwood2]